MRQYRSIIPFHNTPKSEEAHDHEIQTPGLLSAITTSANKIDRTLNKDWGMHKSINL